MIRFILVFVLFLFGSAGAMLHASSANDELWSILKTQPNLVVLMRHAHPDVGSGNPLYWDKTGNCKNERMISEEGKVFAKKVGEMFVEKNINPFVISSPMCRTTETATLAFGKEDVTDPALRVIVSDDSDRSQTFLDKANELFIKNKGKRPMVFISHRPNVAALSFELISVTELIVASVEDDGEIEVIGILKL